jgi:hypothetical protein
MAYSQLHSGQRSLDPLHTAVATTVTTLYSRAHVTLQEFTQYLRRACANVIFLQTKYISSTRNPGLLLNNTTVWENPAIVTEYTVAAFQERERQARCMETVPGTAVHTQTYFPALQQPTRVQQYRVNTSTLPVTRLKSSAGGQLVNRHCLAVHPICWRPFPVPTPVCRVCYAENWKYVARVILCSNHLMQTERSIHSTFAPNLPLGVL